MFIFGIFCLYTFFLLHISKFLKFNNFLWHWLLIACYYTNRFAFRLKLEFLMIYIGKAFVSYWTKFWRSSSCNQKLEKSHCDIWSYDSTGVPECCNKNSPSYGWAAAPPKVGSTKDKSFNSALIIESSFPYTIKITAIVRILFNINCIKIKRPKYNCATL